MAHLPGDDSSALGISNPPPHPSLEAAAELPAGTPLVRVILIDSHPEARAALRNLLRAHSAVRIVGELSGFRFARSRLSVPDYDVVFIETNLAGRDGFELVPYVRPGAKIVLVSSGEQQAARAFDVGAADYLVKPISAARLATSLLRHTTSGGLPDARNVAPIVPTGDFVAVKDGVLTRLLRLSDIQWVASCQNYSVVLLGTGKRVSVRRTMQQWAEALPDDQFVRIHRTKIVNLDRIARMEPRLSRGPQLFFSGDATPLDVSRRYVTTFRLRLALRRAQPPAHGADVDTGTAPLKGTG